MGPEVELLWFNYSCFMRVICWTFNYNNSDYLYEYEGVDEGKELRTHFVDKIYLEGEEGFEKEKKDNPFFEFKHNFEVWLCSVFA
jgi:hypothetical protein